MVSSLGRKKAVGKTAFHPSVATNVRSGLHDLSTCFAPSYATLPFGGLRGSLLGGGRSPAPAFLCHVASQLSFSQRVGQAMGEINRSMSG
jgi:hypothetical protein